MDNQGQNNDQNQPVSPNDSSQGGQGAVQEPVQSPVPPVSTPEPVMPEPTAPTPEPVTPEPSAPTPSGGDSGNTNPGGGMSTPGM